ncbi:MAG: hypothetical protein H6R00_2332 [Proteobacteria bacterium]|nr:hypothetical protein [Pseudomonadota bacterium]
MGTKFGGNFVAKLGFTGFALAGCLALTSCNTTSGSHLLPSAFDYPEANAYVDCVVAHTRTRALAKGRQLKNMDVYDANIGAYGDCEPLEKPFRAHVKANGLSDIRLNDLIVELRTKAGDLAWDEFSRIRLAQLKAEGKIH